MTFQEPSPRGIYVAKHFCERCNNQLVPFTDTDTNKDKDKDKEEGYTYLCTKCKLKYKPGYSCPYCHTNLIPFTKEGLVTRYLCTKCIIEFPIQEQEV